MGNINFFDTYTMLAIMEEIVPQSQFFLERYFPTGAGDIFKSDKVLTEYRKGDRKMAAFVSDRVGDIGVARRGYSVNEYTPAKIAPSRPLTLDDLKQRGFGEALYATSTPAERAARIQKQDLTDLNNRILRREEWMAVQTMINNACTMQTYIDGATQGEQLYVKYFEDSSDHTYTIQHAWNAVGGDFMHDVSEMCRLLAKRGLPSTDLILGTEVAAEILKIEEVMKWLDNKRMLLGNIDPALTKYPGVSYLGQFNFFGHTLNMFVAEETYVDANGQEQYYFPTTSAMVTAPNCGHMVYGQVTQINKGDTEFSTYAGKRVPKLVVDEDNDIRKLRVVSRPLAVPRNYCPYIYAANAVE